MLYTNPHGRHGRRCGRVRAGTAPCAHGRVQARERTSTAARKSVAGAVDLRVMQSRFGITIRRDVCLLPASSCNGASGVELHLVSRRAMAKGRRVLKLRGTTVLLYANHHETSDWSNLLHWLSACLYVAIATALSAAAASSLLRGTSSGGRTTRTYDTAEGGEMQPMNHSQFYVRPFCQSQQHGGAWASSRGGRTAATGEIDSLLGISHRRTV